MSTIHRPDADLSVLLDGAPIERERISFDHPLRVNKGGSYVLVWAQKAQRSRDNPALDLGFFLANSLRLPLAVLFVLTDYPGAKPPHYGFMLEGVRELAADLRGRGAAFMIDGGPMVPTVAPYGREAAIVIADEGKLSFEREWRKSLSTAAGMPTVLLVETESVVPPATASDRLEWSAATLRRKISAKLPFFLNPPPSRPFECSIPCRTSDFPSRDELLSGPAIGKASGPGKGRKSGQGGVLRLQRIAFKGGWAAGMERFARFAGSGALGRYGEARNDPLAHGQSEMSPYLHFGQVSPVCLARTALAASESAAQPYIEQLVVRRELALNFVLHCPGYDGFEGATPDWAQKSLRGRRGLSTRYTLAELERGESDDRFWNAAQKEMILTGKMHNYLRMYWGKQLLSWFADPREAFKAAVYLNDTYSLDGRDPNGYAGIAWCFGRHDRPWPTRGAFGSLRSMTASGLGKKFDIERYTKEVEDLYTMRVKETS